MDCSVESETPVQSKVRPESPLTNSQFPPVMGISPPKPNNARCKTVCSWLSTWTETNSSSSAPGASIVKLFRSSGAGVSPTSNGLMSIIGAGGGLAGGLGTAGTSGQGGGLGGLLGESGGTRPCQPGAVTP